MLSTKNLSFLCESYKTFCIIIFRTLTISFPSKDHFIPCGTEDFPCTLFNITCNQNLNRCYSEFSSLVFLLKDFPKLSSSAILYNLAKIELLKNFQTKFCDYVQNFKFWIKTFELNCPIVWNTRAYVSKTFRANQLWFRLLSALFQCCSSRGTL